MTSDSKPTFPLAVVGCDFRLAPAALREKLVMSDDEKSTLHRSMQSIDPGSGLLVLETCNRIEWIVSSDQTEWMADLLKARVLARWQNAGSVQRQNIEPYIRIGENAVNHVLRVVAGIESLAAGEAQIAGQFQKALDQARVGGTSSIIINGLGSAAGRIAKTATRIGFRSNSQTGIHGLAAKYIEEYLLERSIQPGSADILVVGMGQIGRKTAAIIEEFFHVSVIRVNRTVADQHAGEWHKIQELPDLVENADAVVLATGSSRAVLDLSDFRFNPGAIPLLILDLGIPRQAMPDLINSSDVAYRSIDDLVKNHEDHRNSPVWVQMEDEISREIIRYRRFSLARDVASLLDTIHQRRREYSQQIIPEYLDAQPMDADCRKRTDSMLQQMIREFSNDVFNSIHQALEDYAGAE